MTRAITTILNNSLASKSGMETRHLRHTTLFAVVFHPTHYKLFSQKIVLSSKHDGHILKFDVLVSFLYHQVYYENTFKQKLNAVGQLTCFFLFIGNHTWAEWTSAKHIICCGSCQNKAVNFISAQKQ